MKDPKCDVCKTPVDLSTGPFVCDNCHVRRPVPSADVLPQADAERKDAPMFRGLLGYFPMALFRVAQHSLISDRKHNPGNVDGPHWARGKSSDHLDCIVRHLAEAHTDPDYHLRALAWRALAALQEHEERKGAAPGASSRGSP